MDLTLLTDEELTAHQEAVYAEIERRQAIAAIPAQIADLSAKYIAAGGDPGKLQPAPEPDTELPAEPEA